MYNQRQNVGKKPMIKFKRKNKNNKNQKNMRNYKNCIKRLIKRKIMNKFNKMN